MNKLLLSAALLSFVSFAQAGDDIVPLRTSGSIGVLRDSGNQYRHKPPQSRIAMCPVDQESAKPLRGHEREIERASDESRQRAHREPARDQRQ